MEKTAIPQAMPVGCLAFLPRVVRVAREHGYALTVHGTMARDFDFVAVPWEDDVSPPEVLASAVIAVCGGFLAPHEESEMPKQKPHGRLCWAIHLAGGPYIDLSVMKPNAK